ncbi:methyl-accepting chemotaxis protein [Pectobacterium actinidiae]|uniref:methyl-accepting chemotaxis protein n=1 Tax=Pectobacterium actinidiae TaxID=1507808 RepID=UPI00404075A1
MNLANWRIGYRLGSGFAILILMLFTVSVFSLSKLSSFQDGARDIVKEVYPQTVDANDLIDNVNGHFVAYLQMMLVSSQEQRQGYVDRIMAYRKEISRLLDNLEKNASGEQALQVADRVAQGDLTSRITVTSKDETGLLLQSLDRMNTSLSTIVGQVRDGAETISTAASQITAGNQDLSSRTEEQASSLEETAASMEQLASTIKNTAENTQQATEIANKATGAAKQSGDVMLSVTQKMRGIRDSSQRMAEIIGVIDGIAFQTNILALNAAVEAARAGEQGRGFAVVAGEVRSLAQRSATAAREIKDLIDDSVSKIREGMELVDTAEETMGGLTAHVKDVHGIISEISQASREQSDGINQMNLAIGQIDTTTQQNAALVEESASAALSLQAQASVLAEAVSAFKIQSYGSSNTESYAPMPMSTPTLSLALAGARKA